MLVSLLVKAAKHQGAVAGSSSDAAAHYIELPDRFEQSAADTCPLSKDCADSSDSCYDDMPSLE